MVNILFFIETLTGGGAEKVLCNLVNHMDLTKFNITVHTVWPCNPSQYLKPGIQYKSLYKTKNKTNRFRYRIGAELGLTYALHIRDDYDIECAYLEAGSTKIISASTNHTAKKIAWVHSELSKSVEDSVEYTRKTSSWYSKFDCIIGVSESTKRDFDEIFHNRFNTRVLYNVIDDTAIREKSAATTIKIPYTGKFTVLSVGRLSPPKNYMRLLRTHRRLLDAGIDHDLWILGEGPERADLEKFVAVNKLKESVWMPGFVENPYPIIKQCDLAVCSSDWEGYSTFITESVILGRPIVTTDVSGMRELLMDSEYGLIVAKDEDSLYLGMKKMIEDDDLRKHYMDKAQQRARHFSAEQLTEKTEKFFEELVGE